MASKRKWKAFVVVKETEMDDIDCIPSSWIINYEDEDEDEYDEDGVDDDEDNDYNLGMVDYAFPSEEQKGKGIVFKKSQKPEGHWPVLSGEAVMTTDSREEAFEHVERGMAQRRAFDKEVGRSLNARRHSYESDTDDSTQWDDFVAVRATINGKLRHDVIPNRWIKTYQSKHSPRDPNDSDESDNEEETSVIYMFPSLEYLGKGIRFAKSHHPKPTWPLVTGEMIKRSVSRADLFECIAGDKKVQKWKKGNTHGTTTESDSEEETSGPSSKKRKKTVKRKKGKSQWPKGYKSRWTLRYPKPGPGIKELMPNTGVYVCKEDLNECIKHRGLGFIKAMMKQVFTDEAIRKCSFTGAPKRTKFGYVPDRPGLNIKARDTLVSYIHELTGTPEKFVCDKIRNTIREVQENLKKKPKETVKYWCPKLNRPIEKSKRKSRSRT